MIGYKSLKDSHAGTVSYKATWAAEPPRISKDAFNLGRIELGARALKAD